MDREVHKEKFSLFLEVFQAKCEITIVPYQGYNTWDPGHKAVKSFISGHNRYLNEMTVVAIENLSHVNSDILIDGSITSIAKDITRNANSITPGLISNISQINNHLVHIITNQANVQKVQEFMDKYLDETVDKLDKETTKMISHDNNKPI